MDLPIVKSKEANAFIDDAKILLDQLVDKLIKRAKNFNG